MAWEQHVFDHDDAVARATEAVLRAVRAGATLVRTHVDLRPPLGTRPLAAVLEAQRRVASVCDVEIVGLLLAPVTGPTGRLGRRLVEDALHLGAAVVGGCANLDPDPAGAVRELVAVAADAGVGLDLHTDEVTDPNARTLDELASAVERSRPAGPVAASHCVSLSLRSAESQAEVAARLAAADIAVVALPATNLYLQARGVPTAPPRGIAPVRALLAGGVNVAAGGDNVQDPFSALGRGDPLAVAELLVTAAHLTVEEAWAAVSAGGRRALRRPPVDVVEGQPAELLAIRAPSLRSAIADAPADRLVIHEGRVVSHAVTHRLVDPAGATSP